MEVAENRKKRKNPIDVIKTSFVVLGVLQIIIGGIFIYSKPQAGITVFIVGLVAWICAYLLSKNKGLGMYLSWGYIVFAIGASVYNKAILAVLLFGYFAYWIYKAQKFLKNNDKK